jgi:beta-1,2-xylosyltransferase
LEGAEDQLHPIYQLLFEGAQNFSRLLSKRRSSTLAEAVEEYIRRYKRNPPKGFDWW